MRRSKRRSTHTALLAPDAVHNTPRLTHGHCAFRWYGPVVLLEQTRYMMSAVEAWQ